MSTVTSTQNFNLIGTETFTADEMPASSMRQIQYNQFVSASNLNSGSTPPAAKAYAERLDGSQMLDLTALVRTFGAALNASGLKLQQIQLVNESSTVSVNVAAGSSNGYAFNGAAGDKTIPAGGKWAEFFNDALHDVDATHKVLQITGTTGQKYSLIMIFG